MKHGSHVALLRGINVGGKNILPMKGLAAIFVAAGCMDVKTYIQSGNVVFKAMEIDGLQAAVRAQIEAQYGLKVPVVLRNAAEIERAIASNPFIKADVAADWMHVMFLEQEPSQEQVAGLDHARSAPDQFVVLGRDVYLHLPHGAAKTKLTNAYFDSKLTTVGTQRNWRTVLTLAEMMAAAR